MEASLANEAKTAFNTETFDLKFSETSKSLFAAPLH